MRSLESVGADECFNRSDFFDVKFKDGRYNGRRLLPAGFHVKAIVLDVPSRIVVGNAVNTVAVDNWVESIQRLEDGCFPCLVLPDKAGNVSEFKLASI